MTPAQRERFSAAIERLGGDYEVLPVIAGMAVEDVPNLIEQTDGHLASGRLNEAAACGHKLKGTLSTFDSGAGLGSLTEMVEAASVGNRDAAAEHWNQCRPTIDALMSDVSELCC